MKTGYCKKVSRIGLAVLDLTPMTEDKTTYLINRINVPNRNDDDGVPLRGHGHARELLQECLADADAEGITLMLEINPSDGLNYEELSAWCVRSAVRKPLEPRHQPRD